MLDRESLGMIVREAWVKWAERQPQPKPSWLVSWHGLAEADKEADRQIGETVAARVVASLPEWRCPAHRAAGTGPRCPYCQDERLAEAMKTYHLARGEEP